MTLWWLYALLGSFFLAMYVYCNQLFKLPAPILMIYRGLGVFTLLLPFSFFMGGSFSWLFYVLSAINGTFIGYIDNRFFRSSKAFGAEATGTIQPLSLGITFLSWIVIKPDYFLDLVSQPLKFILIIACLTGIVICVAALKNGKVSKRALLYLLPSIIISGLLDTNNKMIMDLGKATPVVTVYFYTMISALFAGIYTITLYLYKKRNLQAIIKKSNLKKGLCVIIFIIGLVVFKGYAMGLAPNPAYVVAIVFLSPLWISLLSFIEAKILKKKKFKKVNLKITTLLVASVTLLVIITR